MLGVLRHSEVEVVSEFGGRDFGANWMAKVRVPRGDNAPTFGALVVGVLAVVMSVLGTKTPPTSLPEGTFLFGVVRFVIATLETIGEYWFASLSFAQDDLSVVAFIIIRGSLSCYDTWYGHARFDD